MLLSCGWSEREWIDVPENDRIYFYVALVRYKPNLLLKLHLVIIIFDK